MAMNILVLGGTGMLGSTLCRYFDSQPGITLWCTTRSEEKSKGKPAQENTQRIGGINAEDPLQVAKALSLSRPDVVINCIGLVKQLQHSHDPISAISINALHPHALARLCEVSRARLIHISTDCVFSGKRGSYKESDTPDAQDLYGRSKLLGEIDSSKAVTLRTSIIGHELASAHGLLEWFLSQRGIVKGYTKAIFSGMPTWELARVIHRFVLPNTNLSGIYHVASTPISKYSLLTLIREIYGHSVQIMEDDSVDMDRSLNADLFKAHTGYIPSDWPTLVAQMYSNR